jgi:hypothetical protein
MEQKVIEKVDADVNVWAMPDREWKAGKRRDITYADEIHELKWVGLGDVTDVAPSPDTVIDVRFARTIAIQVDSTPAANTSTDFDVNVESSLDGTLWDTVAYAEVNIGDTAIKTFLVAPGPAFIRLRGDQNDTSESGDVTCRVLVVR